MFEEIRRARRNFRRRVRRLSAALRRARLGIALGVPSMKLVIARAQWYNRRPARIAITSKQSSARPVLCRASLKESNRPRASWLQRWRDSTAWASSGVRYHRSTRSAFMVFGVGTGIIGNHLL